MWVRFDDQFTTHRKVNGLTDTEFRLHVEAVFWCARNLTDGRVGQDELDLVSRIRSPRKHVAKLVDRGLWHRSGQQCEAETCPAHNAVTSGATAGWVIHDYWEYQFTKDRVLKEREDNALRQKRWREQQKQSRNGVTNGRRNAASNPTPARPGPAPGSGTGGGVAQGGSQDRDPPHERCPAHADAPADGPCGPCGDARRTRLAWDRDQARQAAAEQSARARERAELRQREIVDCKQGCDDRGYLPSGRVCHHRPPSRVGAAAVREALRRAQSDPEEADRAA